MYGEDQTVGKKAVDKDAVLFKFFSSKPLNQFCFYFYIFLSKWDYLLSNRFFGHFDYLTYIVNHVIIKVYDFYLRK